MKHRSFSAAKDWFFTIKKNKEDTAAMVDDFEMRKA